jgi:hypothetical protein
MATQFYTNHDQLTQAHCKYSKSEKQFIKKHDDLGRALAKREIYLSEKRLEKARKKRDAINKKYQSNTDEFFKKKWWLKEVALDEKYLDFKNKLMTERSEIKDQLIAAKLTENLAYAAYTKAYGEFYKNFVETALINERKQALQQLVSKTKN